MWIIIISRKNLRERGLKPQILTTAIKWLTTYKSFKVEFCHEPYLHLVTNIKHRKALTRLRCSSHHLAIETGRWTKPITPRNQRLCALCLVIEDEEHFLWDCLINEKERNILITKLKSFLGDAQFNIFYENFFINIFKTTDQYILQAFSNFVYNSFKSRENYHAA